MNSKFIKITAIISIIFIIVCFGAGCSSKTADAQAKFDQIMTAFKSCDKEKIDEAYGLAEVMSYIDKTSGEELADALISTLSQMEYRVLSVEETSGSAVCINVEITTVNFSETIKKYIDKVAELINSREYKATFSTMEREEYEALMYEKMIEAIGETQDTKSTKKVDVTMMKTNGKWRVGGNSEEFLEVLFVGLGSAVGALM